MVQNGYLAQFLDQIFVVLHGSSLVGCWWPVLISGFANLNYARDWLWRSHNLCRASACAFTNTAEDCTSIPPTIVVRAPIQFPEGAGCKLAFPILMRLGCRYSLRLYAEPNLESRTQHIASAFPTRLNTHSISRRQWCNLAFKQMFMRLGADDCLRPSI
jgi:hypothetical protein